MYMIPYMAVAIMAFTPGKEAVQNSAKYLHYAMISLNPIYTCSGFFFMVNKVIRSHSLYSQLYFNADIPSIKRYKE